MAKINFPLDPVKEAEREILIIENELASKQRSIILLNKKLIKAKERLERVKINRLKGLY